MAAGTRLAAALDDNRHALLTTIRRTGRPLTPVWFGVAGGGVYFRTPAGTGKAKRLRRNSRGHPIFVEVAPS